MRAEAKIQLRPDPTGLKPVNLVQAAQQDIISRDINVNYATRGFYRAYAFHREHVRRAVTARNLIELALQVQDPLKPLKIGKTKKWTRMIYGDDMRPVLAEALVLLQSRLQEPS